MSGALLKSRPPRWPAVIFANSRRHSFTLWSDSDTTFIVFSRDGLEEEKEEKKEEGEEEEEEEKKEKWRKKVEEEEEKLRRKRDISDMREGP